MTSTVADTKGNSVARAADAVTGHHLPWRLRPNSFSRILCLTDWRVEPDVTDHTLRLGSTGECGVPQNQGGVST